MLRRDHTIIIKVSKEEKELLLYWAGEVPLSRFARAVLLSPANRAIGVDMAKGRDASIGMSLKTGTMPGSSSRVKYELEPLEQQL